VRETCRRTPTAKRRESLRKAIREKPGGRLWKFASLTDLTVESLLIGDVWYPGIGDPGPLLKQ
jgi:hypothetical protein